MDQIYPNQLKYLGYRRVANSRLDYCKNIFPKKLKQINIKFPLHNKPLQLNKYKTDPYILQIFQSDVCIYLFSTFFSHYILRKYISVITSPLFLPNGSVFYYSVRQPSVRCVIPIFEFWVHLFLRLRLLT